MTEEVAASKAARRTRTGNRLRTRARGNVVRFAVAEVLVALSVGSMALFSQAGEANFAAFLACNENDDVRFRYAAYYNAF